MVPLGNRAGSAEDAPNVFNLTVLVRAQDGVAVSARAANLDLPIVEENTLRAALNRIVGMAKGEIERQLGVSNEIAWVQPPLEPNEMESKFVVPLHL